VWRIKKNNKFYAIKRVSVDDGKTEESFAKNKKFGCRKNGTFFFNLLG
jgi:hypothetical protein